MKILTLDDLYTYFSNQDKSMTFSAGNGEVIVVGVQGKMNFKKSENDMEGLYPVVLQACHTNKNKNGSMITEKNMKKALPSFANRPILAYIHKVDEQDEFGWHAMHIEDDELVYDEVPVGIIPESNNATLEYSEEKDRYYVNINGYIFEEYSKAKDILERDGEAAVSVELGVRELSYDAKEKVLCIDDFYFEGVTILGVDEDGNEVKAGMEGSNIKLSDFSRSNSVFNYNEKLLEQLEMLNNNLKAFNINNKGRKEDGTVKFDELLKEYNVTIDDIDFDYEEMSDEELEAKFDEMFGDNVSEEDPTSDNIEDESETEEFEEEASEEDIDDEADFEEEVSEGSEENAEEDVEEVTEDDFSATYSVTRKGIKRDFEISMTQIISALSDLVNATYSETDDAWYCVDVYEDSKSVIMIDYWRNKAFKQNYKVRNGQYTLVGDRVEVFSQWLTSDEIAELDKMRSNYSSISDRLNKYVEAEEDQNKMAIFENEDYVAIAQTEDFTNLIENRADFSVDEVQQKCDEMLLNYVKNNNLFSEKHDNVKVKSNMIKLPLDDKKKKGRYGNLFSK